MEVLDLGDLGAFWISKLLELLDPEELGVFGAAGASGSVGTWSYSELGAFWILEILELFGAVSPVSQCPLRLCVGQARLPQRGQ